MSQASAWNSAAKSNEKFDLSKICDSVFIWMPFSTWSGFYVYESDFWTKLGYFGHSECCAYSHKLFQRWRRKVCLCPLYNYVSFYLVQMFLLSCHFVCLIFISYTSATDFRKVVKISFVELIFNCSEAMNRIVILQSAALLFLPFAIWIYLIILSQVKFCSIIMPGFDLGNLQTLGIT